MYFESSTVKLFQSCKTVATFAEIQRPLDGGTE